MRGNIYNQSFRGHHKKKSIETRETNEFPNIKSHNSLEKNNNIRNQVNDTKEKITEMEARLNKLRKLKEEFDVKTKHNITRAEFMRNVKERVHRDREYKQNVIKSLFSFGINAMSLSCNSRGRLEASETVSSKRRNKLNKISIRNDRFRRKRREESKNSKTT